MNTNDQSKAVAFSETVFRRLLVAYPKAHREKFGEPMAQLFRDQCRDAWNESRGWGLTKLWLRVLPDVAATSFLEHLESHKQRKNTHDRTLFGSVDAYRFATAFSAVFLLVVSTATVVTFLMPERYVGEAKVYFQKFSMEPASRVPDEWPSIPSDGRFLETQKKVILSDAVLEMTIQRLNLNEEWSRKYAAGGTLKTSTSIALLRKMTTLATSPHNPVIRIEVYSGNPNEAAQIANGITEAYRKFTWQNHEDSGNDQFRVLVMKLAAPNPIPARPNKPLNIAIGVVLGIALGLLAGAAAVGVSVLSQRNAPPKIVT